MTRRTAVDLVFWLYLVFAGLLAFDGQLAARFARVMIDSFGGAPAPAHSPDAREDH